MNRTEGMKKKYSYTQKIEQTNLLIYRNINGRFLLKGKFLKNIKPIKMK